MRVIKFRAWEPDTKIMFVPTGIPNPTMSPDRTKGILMQYTGLKDANGKEIYEGDIINFKQGETYFWGVIVATVEYNDGGFYPFADREDMLHTLNQKNVKSSVTSIVGYCRNMKTLI